ncbi:MAG: phosphoglucosamine mutase [Bacillota bacterium]
MAVLFGTDGVRGVANKDLTPETALRLGRAGGAVLSKSKAGSRVIIGKDTRKSCDMLEAALAAGLCSAGVDVLLAGVLPTPGVACLIKELGAAGGVVISASHNSFEDNGIKFFGPGGYKLTDGLELEIEQLALGNLDTIPAPTGGGVGRIADLPDAVDRYVGFLKNTVQVDFSGLKVVLDCANGAASGVAPGALAELGAEVIAINNRPDGVNINLNCGSTCLDMVQAAVREHRADLGLAHDGDADRVLAVDAAGRIVDGDQIMVICARYLKELGRLAGNTIVVTVMSNLGLHLAMRESGIKVLETKVGDRYVLEEMLRSGARFGGEQSGHILFLDHATTGDGLLTALQLLAAVKEKNKPLGELAAQMEKLPQLLVNVKVNNKQEVMASNELAEAIAAAERCLAGSGRILVRPSGTEPLVRVMGEGRDAGELRAVVDELVDLVRRLGV